MLHVIYDDYVLCQDPGDALPHQQCDLGVPRIVAVATFQYDSGVHRSMMAFTEENCWLNRDAPRRYVCKVSLGPTTFRAATVLGI